MFFGFIKWLFQYTYNNLIKRGQKNSNMINGTENNNPNRKPNNFCLLLTNIFRLDVYYFYYIFTNASYLRLLNSSVWLNININKVECMSAPDIIIFNLKSPFDDKTIIWNSFLVTKVNEFVFKKWILHRILNLRPTTP